MSRTASVAVAFGPSSNVIATRSPVLGPCEIVAPNQVSCGSLAPVQPIIATAATSAPTGTIHPRARRRPPVGAVTAVTDAATTVAATATASDQRGEETARTATTVAMPASAPTAIGPGHRHGRGEDSPAPAPAS